MTPEARAALPTEAINPATLGLDQLTPLEFVRVMQVADREAVLAVAEAETALAAAIELIATALQAGGTLTYVGAGTSGRLGVLDAAECWPTFQATAIKAVIAGGAEAMLHSVEGAEDDGAAGVAAVAHLQPPDVVLGISASGSAPYVRAAVAAARERGLQTLFLACVPAVQVPLDCDLDIRVITGPEVLAGSTRLKAGTATKLVLNTLSTGVMARLDKVYGNLMVDVAVTNAKLQERALRIIEQVLGREQPFGRTKAATLLAQAHNQLKPALVMAKHQCSYAEALNLLATQPLRTLLA